MTNSRGQNTPRGGRSCAEKKPRGDRRAAAAQQDEVEESDATEDEATGGRTFLLSERREWGDREVA